MTTTLLLWALTAGAAPDPARDAAREARQLGFAAIGPPARPAAEAVVAVTVEADASTGLTPADLDLVSAALTSAWVNALGSGPPPAVVASAPLLTFAGGRVEAPAALLAAHRAHGREATWVVWLHLTTCGADVCVRGPELGLGAGTPGWSAIRYADVRDTRRGPRFRQSSGVYKAWTWGTDEHDVPIVPSQPGDAASQAIDVGQAAIAHAAAIWSRRIRPPRR